MERDIDRIIALLRSRNWTTVDFKWINNTVRYRQRLRVVVSLRNTTFRAMGMNDMAYRVASRRLATTDFEGICPRAGERPAATRE